MDGLDKSEITIPLGMGLRTDVDEKLLPVGKVSQLENMYWLRQDEMTKRPGSVAVGSQYISASPAVMPTPWQLGTLKGSLVSLSKAGPRPVGAYSPALDKFSAPQAITNDGPAGIVSKLRGPLLVTRAPVFRSQASTGATFNESPDIATDGTFALVAWIGNDGLQTHVYAKIVEVATGKTLFFSTLDTGAVLQAKARYANGFFSAVWNSGGGVLNEAHWASAAIAAGTGTPSANIVLANDFNGAPYNYDLTVVGNNVLLVYGGSSKTNLVMWPGGSPASLTAKEIKTPTSTTIPPGTVAWVDDLGGTGVLSLSICNANGVQTFENINTGTGISTAVQTLDAGTIGPIITMAAHTLSPFVPAIEHAIVYQTFTTLKLATHTAASGNLSTTWINSASLMSRTFAHNGDFYALIAYESTVQGTYFAIRVPTNGINDPVDMTRAPSARFATALAQGLTGSVNGHATTTSVVVLNGSTLLSAAVIRTGLIEQPGLNGLFDTGVDLLTLAFDTTAVGGAKEHADSLYACGGVMGQFDGQAYAEEGFHLRPEAPTLTGTTGGALTALGSYVYSGCFRYDDANGRRHRSRPSNLSPVTLTAGQGSVSVVFKTLKLHGRPGSVVLEVYRTANAGDPATALVLVGIVANNETVDTVTFLDTVSDQNANESQDLYTNGGIFPNETPPVPLALTPYLGGLAVVDADDPTLIWISLPLQALDGPQGPQFISASQVRIDDQHGPIAALAAMDDKLIAFKGDAVYVITGPGPNADGSGGQWSTPNFVAIGTGCVQPRSVCEVPDGIMFRCNSNRAGYYLLDRGLSLSYLGSPVQAYVGDTVVDAVHFPLTQRTHIFTTAGRTQVLDHAISKLAGEPMWNTYTNQAAVAAGSYNGRPVYQFGFAHMALMREDATGTVWDELGSPNDEYVLTPWISAAGLKGYERFYLLQGVGTFVGQHTVTVTMYVNFDMTVPFSTTSRVIGPSGTTSDWNAWEHKHPSKFSSFRFGIRCSKVPADPADTAGANINAIVITWGRKIGQRKVPFGNRLT
jgi:hypothetical protein